WPATADADEHQPRAARARRPRAVSAKARSVLALRQVAAALEIAAGVLGGVGDARLRGRHAALRDDQEVLADAHLPAAERADHDRDRAGETADARRLGDLVAVVVGLALGGAHVSVLGAFGRRRALLLRVVQAGARRTLERRRGDDRLGAAAGVGPDEALAPDRVLGAGGAADQRAEQDRNPDQTWAARPPRVHEIALLPREES